MSHQIRSIQLMYVKEEDQINVNTGLLTQDFGIAKEIPQDLPLIIKWFTSVWNYLMDEKTFIFYITNLFPYINDEIRRNIKEETHKYIDKNSGFWNNLLSLSILPNFHYKVIVFIPYASPILCRTYDEALQVIGDYHGNQ